MVQELTQSQNGSKMSRSSTVADTGIKNRVHLYLWVAGEVTENARYEYTRLTLTCDNFG